MVESQFNKKKVAKNTMFLYFRMILIMLVQFYTVRITLLCLGVTDYGIYNLVGGVTNLFTFLTHTMTSASQRFFAYDIGQGNEQALQSTFDTVLVVFILLGLVSIALLEVVGNWLLVYKLVIPAERLFAAKVIFHISLISLFLTIVSLPFNSLIIAHEEMKTFAYVSIAEAVLKLVVVYFLLLVNTDKLILYATLYLLVNLLISVTYMVKCFRSYKECDNRLSYNKEIIGKIIPFMSWNLLGGFSWMLCTQGLTILMNIFFGPTVNAAKAIADKLDGVVNSFMNNFMMAAQPQIVKTYANNEMKEMQSLIFLSSRISFYLVMSLSLPVVFNAKVLLSVWLGQTDFITVSMVQSVFLISLVGSLENPINQAIRATGEIKNYQLYVAFISFGVLPLSYVFFKVGMPAYYGYISYFVIYTLALLARLYFLKKQIGVSYSSYLKNVVLKQMTCLILAVGCSCLACTLIGANDIFQLFTRASLICIICLTTIFVAGFSRNEKKNILSVVSSKLK